MNATNLSISGSSDDPLPVTQGRLLDFPDDPIACMRALYSRHGTVCAMEEQGQRIHFVFGPEFNHLVLSGSGLWPRSTLLGPNWTRLPDNAATRGAVAITIDDGPDPDVTPGVLEKR